MGIKSKKTVSSKGTSSRTLTIGTVFQEYIGQCKRRGALGTARNYQRTYNSFRAFLGYKVDMPIGQLDAGLIGEYESWLMAKGMTRNSSSFYMRNLRAVYNKAVLHGEVQPQNIFHSVYTGIDHTRKRAVREKIIMDLQKLDLRYSKALDLARDLFVFSYCTRGMAFVDVAFLRKEDISCGVISYVRRKTSQRLSVGVEPCIARIIGKYAEEVSDSPYVFPIIRAADGDEAYRQYTIALNYHNRKLKVLGRLIGLEVPLSSYTARHTWATVARDHNVPVSVISAGMGHTSEKTTQIYLDALDSTVIDAANRGILGSLNRMVST